MAGAAIPFRAARLKADAASGQADLLGFPAMAESLAASWPAAARRQVGRAGCSRYRAKRVGDLRVAQKTGRFAFVRDAVCAFCLGVRMRVSGRTRCAGVVNQGGTARAFSRPWMVGCLSRHSGQGREKALFVVGGRVCGCVALADAARLRQRSQARSRRRRGSQPRA